MMLADALMLAVQIVVFASGAALLSHQFYAAYRRWMVKEFRFKQHLPGILGSLLMLFAIASASSLGWPYVVATVVAGFTVAYLYVYILRLRVEVGLIGPALALLTVFLPLGDI